MNERIEELLGQALDKAVPETWTTLTPGQVVKLTDKFAELMVKKFDDILVLEYLDCVGNEDKQAAERIERLRGKVKTYFGVE